MHAEVVDVYRAAFTQPPFGDTEKEVGWFDQELASDDDPPDFRCFVARRAGSVVGFAYGFRTFETSPGTTGTPSAPDGRPETAGSWIRGRFALG